MKNCPCRITSAQIHLNVKHYSMKLEGNDLFLCDSYDLYNDNMHWACWPPGSICNFKFFLTTQIILNYFFKHFQCPKLIKYMLHVIKRNLSSPNAPHLFFSILSHVGIVRKKKLKKRGGNSRPPCPYWGTPLSLGIALHLPSISISFFSYLSVQPWM
jgi:hypothetical protein